MQNDTVESLLNKAKELEKKYEWLQASEVYRSASGIALNKKEVSKAVEINEKIGFCYFKAAFQANTNSLFKKRIKYAIKIYEEALELIQKSSDYTSQLYRIRASIAYSNSWFEFEPQKKKKFLDEWWILESNILKAYEKIGNQFAIAKTCNDMLEGSANCRYWLGINWKDSMKIRDEIISLGERSIEILTEEKERS